MVTAAAHTPGPLYDCGDPECGECIRTFRRSAKAPAAMHPVAARLKWAADNQETPANAAAVCDAGIDTITELFEVLKLAVAAHEDPGIWLDDARALIAKAADLHPSR